jgi:hypothetical protein
VAVRRGAFVVGLVGHRSRLVVACDNHAVAARRLGCVERPVGLAEQPRRVTAVLDQASSCPSSGPLRPDVFRQRRLLSDVQVDGEITDHPDVGEVVGGQPLHVDRSCTTRARR